MKFKPRNLRAIAEMIIGDAAYFPYRSSYYITEFFKDCDLDFHHDGSTRWKWTTDRVEELLDEAQPAPNTLPTRFSHLLRVLMDKADATDDDPDRTLALLALNIPLEKEGYEAYYGEDRQLYIRHLATNTLSNITNPHRPLTPHELKKRTQLINYLDQCSEDELIEQVLLPLFRQLGYHRVTAVGHKDKSLEYGKDVWMRFTLPTQHILYFGIQAKKGKLDASGVSRGSNSNIAEIHNQALMMLGHEIFDPEINKRSLVDHAFIISGGEITKQAKNWLGEKLDTSRRSQIMFMDRDDILNLYITSNIPLPSGAIPQEVEDFNNDDIPF